jgi:hypothetical protein
MVRASITSDGISISWTAGSTSSPVLYYTVSAMNMPSYASSSQSQSNNTSNNSTSTNDSNDSDNNDDNDSNKKENDESSRSALLDSSTITTTTTTTSNVVLTGLTTGLSYRIRITATNTHGESVAVYSRVALISGLSGITVPSAPTNVRVERGNGLAVISFDASSSSSDSSGSTTVYTVISSDGRTATSSSSPIIMSGLTNGQSYTFTVVASNSQGSSDQSDASTSIIPGITKTDGSPDAPTITAVTVNSNSASVTFQAPLNTGGSGITGYVVYASPTGRSASGSNSPLTVTGLTNGITYSFTLFAVNKAGMSVGAVSDLITPGAPSSPTSVTATSLSATSATVGWNAPSSVGAGITHYSVSANPGGQTVIVNGTTTSTIISGLTTGLTYMFSVSSIYQLDGNGSLVASGSAALSSSVVIGGTSRVGLPAAPTITSVQRLNTATLVFFSPPSITSSPSIRYATLSPNRAHLIEAIG